MGQLLHSSLVLSILMYLLTSLPLLGATSPGHAQRSNMPPKNVFAELHGEAKSFKTKKITERIQMPDNFFEVIHNASAQSNLTYTDGRKLTNRRRRLNSEFCRRSFSNLETGFVWMGNADLEKETDFEASYWSLFGESYFDSDNFFIVHNKPQENIFSADEICFEIIFRKEPIGFNKERLKELRPAGTSGIVCNDCYAHAGAHVLAGMRCLKETVVILCLLKCRCETSAF
jgi:hypothetical protein